MRGRFRCRSEDGFDKFFFSNFRVVTFRHLFCLPLMFRIAATEDRSLETTLIFVRCHSLIQLMSWVLTNPFFLTVSNWPMLFIHRSVLNLTRFQISAQFYFLNRLSPKFLKIVVGKFILPVASYRIMSIYCIYFQAILGMQYYCYSVFEDNNILLVFADREILKHTQCTCSIAYWFEDILPN